jgi:thioredoxin 1
MMAPVLRQVADRLAGRLRVGKLNVEEHETVWEKVDSQSLPTVVLYRDGTPVHTVIGFGHTPDELVAELEPHLA